MTWRCVATRKDGSRCNGYSVGGGDYCFTHDPQRAAERAEAHRKGGRLRHKRPDSTPEAGDQLTMLANVDISGDAKSTDGQPTDLIKPNISGGAETEDTQLADLKKPETSEGAETGGDQLTNVIKHQISEGAELTNLSKPVFLDGSTAGQDTLPYRPQTLAEVLDALERELQDYKAQPAQQAQPSTDRSRQVMADMRGEVTEQDMGYAFPELRAARRRRPDQHIQAMREAFKSS